MNLKYLGNFKKKNHNMKKRILIVDDDPLNLIILQQILHGSYILEEAATGAIALEKVASFRPELILLDVMMPEMDGYEVCLKIKQEPLFKDIPILFLSAKIEAEDKLRGFEVGAADYITKPFNADEIMARIKTHLKLKDALLMIQKYNNQLEEMLEKRTRELVKVERHAAFSLFIQGIIHNLRNPLSSIMACTSLLEMGVEDVAEIKNERDIEKCVEQLEIDVETVKTSCNQMNEMISLLMHKSRTDRINTCKLVDLNAIINEELKFLHADTEFRRKTKKIINISNEKLYVEVIPSAITQVIQNLIRNAIDAMWNQPNATISITSGGDENYCWFTVADNGSGIDKKNLEDIFNPFYSTKAPIGENKDGEPTGTGLGLFASLETVQQHSGDIKVRSTVGSGSEFTVILPRKEYLFKYSNPIIKE